MYFTIQKYSSYPGHIYLIGKYDITKIMKKWKNYITKNSNIVKFYYSWKQ